MSNKYFWLAVTADEYELPLAIEDSAEKLAKLLGIGKTSITEAVKNNYDGSRSGRKFIRVEKE